MVGIALMTQCCEPENEPCYDPTNVECVNFDPCAWNPPTGGFKMRSTPVGFVVPENLEAEWCDTIFRSGVEFRADMVSAKSYTWYIGTETTPRTGRQFPLSFEPYTDDTLNLNPDNPDYYLPLNITLEVRNDPGPCVSPDDTLLISTRQLVFTKKILTIGTFRGYVEGENFTRDVIFWQKGEDLDNPVFAQRYFGEIIGLPSEDTIRYYGIYGSFDVLVSYKNRKWEIDSDEWWIATDGIRVWDQTITTFPDAPDRVDLYYERIPEGSTEVETVRFSGERIE